MVQNEGKIGDEEVEWGTDVAYEAEKKINIEIMKKIFNIEDKCVCV